VSQESAPERFLARSLTDLPPLKDTLTHLGLLADKRFGQHFLFDMNICRKIVRLAGDFEGQVVIEVGPGPGGLTRALLESGAHIIAVEKDPRFGPVLDELEALAPGRLFPVVADALTLDEASVVTLKSGGDAARIVSNLPYNVGTALFLKWLLGPWRPSSMTLMFQKEVALRIVAKPGSAAFGRLSVIAQALCETRLIMDLPARAFTPPPKVDSAVIMAIPRAPRPPDTLIRALETVTGAAFGQRRKMLRSALKALGGADLCVKAGIDPDVRGEAITVADFCALAQVHLDARKEFSQR
jgi:16S rRNA (adenine1518-N6/adenine1519-N6)-dimethyltransferase